MSIVYGHGGDAACEYIAVAWYVTLPVSTLKLTVASSFSARASIQWQSCVCVIAVVKLQLDLCHLCRTVYAS